MVRLAQRLLVTRDEALTQRVVSYLDGHARPYLRPGVMVNERPDSRRGRDAHLRRPGAVHRRADARVGERDHARTDPVASGLRAGSTVLLPVEPPSVTALLRPLRPPGSDKHETW